VVCSGTATVEAALAETPHVIVYRTGGLSYRIARWLATVEHIGMANIVLGRRAFPELLQEELTPRAIADHLHALFLDPDDTARERQRSDARELRRRLGEPGCFERVAELALARLDASTDGTD
jgi:lipid-A-disaccharide synthase